MDYFSIEIAAKRALEDEARTRLDEKSLDEETQKIIARAIVEAIKEYDRQKFSM